MSVNGLKKVVHIPVSISLIVFVIGAMAIAGSVLLLVLRPGSKAADSKVEASGLPPLAARVDRFDGDVGIARQTGSQAQPYPDWTKATVNSPLSIGDRVYVKQGSRAAIAFSGRNYARLSPRTSLDVVSLTQRRTQLALREGSGTFDVGALAPDEMFEVATPNGAVDFTEPGLYQVGIDDRGQTLVSVLSGLAQVVGLAGSGEVSKGQLLTLAAAQAAEALVSQLSPGVAGNIVDDYYSYRYPDTYDGRYADYQTYQDDPYYNDPYRRSVSYQYVPDNDEVAGLDDLDSSGDWNDVPGYGHCWHPHESSDWAPYRDGYWSNDYPLGLTWVSNERWGWAPYHYGRWANVDRSWYWVPGDVVSQPVYSPALVAFVPFPQPDRIGWVPLGPGDPYVPRYYDPSYQPRYIGSSSFVNKYIDVTNIVNYNVPGAVTVVTTNQITRGITPNSVVAVDPTILASTRPVVDPFAVPAIRQLAPNLEAVRPRVPLPADVQQSLVRPVIASQQPVVPTVAANIADALKVQPVSERAKRKLQVNSSGQAVATTQPNGLPSGPIVTQQTNQGSQQSLTTQERQARIAALAAEAAQGNKAAKQEMHQLEEQDRLQAKAERKSAAQQAAGQQAQQAERQRAEKQTARQQALQAEQQRQAQLAQEAEQRRAQKQAARQQAQQQAEQQQQAQAAQQAEQRRAQKQAARQQGQQQAEQQRQAQASQQADQRRAQKQAARQQAQQQAEGQRQAQAAQEAEQRRAQKQAARQQAVQQEAVRQQQQRELEKAQRKAAQQQAQQQEAARQQAQQDEQRRAQRQAQLQREQEAQQQREQQKAQRRAERQRVEQQQQNPPQGNPSKEERRAEKAKNKNKSSNP